MDIFEIHTYDRMPVLPAPPALAAFGTLFQRRAPQLREPSALVSFWRTWLSERD